MVKDHSNSERQNTLPQPHGLIFHTDRTSHTTVFVTPVVEHWMELSMAQLDKKGESIQRPIIP